MTLTSAKMKFLHYNSFTVTFSENKLDIKKVHTDFLSPWVAEGDVNPPGDCV